MKNMKKFFSFLLTIIMSLSMFTVVNATSTILPGERTPTLGDSSAEAMVDTVIGAVFIICRTIAFGMLIYVGIKYVMASANEKADIKSASIRYLIGAIVILAVTGLFDILREIAVDVGSGLA